MLSLGGFELFSRWVPLKTCNCLSNALISSRGMLAHSRRSVNLRSQVIYKKCIWYMTHVGFTHGCG